ncbi:MAG: hypothetical protein IJU40_01850 [Desulfovibrionaceae bacterium]|nr:hypothetical protein [Desulfovibrionaceae bacterium]
MIGLTHTLWWLLVTALGIVVQTMIPRIDALVAAMILLLQDRNYKIMVWLLPLFVLLQEGLGTRIFGGTLVWYIVIGCLFKIGERFFSTKTFLFVFFLSAAIGVAYYALNVLLAPLQDLEVNPQELLDTSLLQSIFTPCSWLFLEHFKPTVEKEPEPYS